MLIIEGPDCAGKTTLAKKFVNLLGRYLPYIYQHLSRLPKGWSLHEYFDLIYLCRVQDRFHISEPLYAQMRGDTSLFQFGDAFQKAIEARLASVGALTVILLPSDSCIKNLWKPDQMYTLDQTLHIAALYREYAWNKANLQTTMVYAFNSEFPAENHQFMDEVIGRYLLQREVYGKVNPKTE